MKNLINLAKISNGMLLNLSLALGIAMLSSCSKDESLSPSAANHSSYREPEDDELLFSFTSQNGNRDVPVSYSIEILANGTGIFVGKGTRFEGKLEIEIEPNLVWDIAYEMKNMGFCDLENEYLQHDDATSYQVTVLNLDVKNVKKVVDHGDAPDVLLDIQRMLIDRTNIRELIGE